MTKTTLYRIGGIFYQCNGALLVKAAKGKAPAPGQMSLFDAPADDGGGGESGVHHAGGGGEDVNGHHYKGGQFTPKGGGGSGGAAAPDGGDAPAASNMLSIHQGEYTVDLKRVTGIEWGEDEATATINGEEYTFEGDDLKALNGWIENPSNSFMHIMDGDYTVNLNHISKVEWEGDDEATVTIAGEEYTFEGDDYAGLEEHLENKASTLVDASLKEFESKGNALLEKGGEQAKQELKDLYLKIKRPMVKKLRTIGMEGNWEDFDATYKAIMEEIKGG